MRAGRRVGAAVATMLAACYSPSPPAGAPCANGACPDPLVCSPATNTCEHGAVSADGHVGDALVADAPSDTRVPLDAAIDAMSIDAAVASFQQLNSEQWLLPCTGAVGSDGLCSAGSASHNVQLGNPLTPTYDVTLRIRAVVEGATYGSGSAVSGTAFYIGGAPATDYLTILELSVSSPPQHYYLNNGTGLPSVIDYLVKIPIDSRAKVTLFISGQDGEQEPNDNGSGSGIIVPGVQTTPSPYNGEFAQMNVISAVPE